MARKVFKLTPEQLKILQTMQNSVQLYWCLFDFPGIAPSVLDKLRAMGAIHGSHNKGFVIDRRAAQQVA